MAYDKADPRYSKVFTNEEFGYFVVNIMRPLRLRVILNHSSLNELKTKSNDDDLVSVVAEYKNRKQQEIIDDFNIFMDDIQAIANKHGLKLTAKRKKAIHEALTEKCPDAMPVLDASGNTMPDKDLCDTEQVPMTYEGGAEQYFEDEIKPYSDDAWLDLDSVGIGYEISILKYFYQPAQLRSMNSIIQDIYEIEKKTDGLISSVLGEENHAKI